MRLFGFGRRRAALEVASADGLKRVGLLDVYAGADPDEVVTRIRAMTYGSSSSNVVKLRKRQQDEEPIVRRWYGA